MALASLRPLRSRNFALIFFAALVSNIGSWMQTVAVADLVTKMTHEARWTGLVAAAAFLPVGLLAPVGGAVADRVDRRLWLLLTTVGETVLASMLALLTASGSATPGSVTVLVFFGGAMASIGFPAYQAMLPDLVDKDDLLAAVSLSSAQFNLGRVVGPALAGAAIVAGSYTWVFTANAVSFGAVIVALLLVRLPPQVRDVEPGTMRSRIATGVRAARDEPGCRTAIALIGLAALLLSPFIALVAAVSRKVFDAGAGGTAALVTAQGVGAVAGALALAPLAERFGRRRLLAVDLLLLPCLLVLYGIAPSFPLAVVALTAVGAGYIGILSGLNTVVQLRAPTWARARVLSLYMLALGTIYPLGALLQGTIGDAVGLRPVIVVTAVAFAVIVVVAGRARPDLAAALEDPARTPASVPVGPPSSAPGPAA